MTKNKKSESATAKQWRLNQIREQMKEFDKWFHPAPDEVAHLLSLVRDWAGLEELGLNKTELEKQGANSVFAGLIKFCKNELGKIVKYCENRRSGSKGTLPDSDIQSIKLLCLASDSKSVEQCLMFLRDVDIVSLLGSIMSTSYRAIENPGTLNDLTISELRGDLLEIVARTYADINIELREQAAQGVKQGLAQAENTIKSTKAAKEVQKGNGIDIEQMKKDAQALKNNYPEWNNSALAKGLCKKHPKACFNTVRQYDWLKKMTAL